MSLIAVILAASLVLTIGLFLRHIAGLERAWTAERRELLTRIQRPELVPLPRSGPVALPDPEPDERDLVGTVAFIPDLEEE